MPLRLELKNSDCRPGNMIDLSVHWESESIPSQMTLQMGWRTTGKGTEDSETVYEESWTPESNSGEKKLRIQLPRGPLSIRGNLVSIAWQFECHSKRPDESCARPFDLSHMDEPVWLTTPNV